MKNQISTIILVLPFYVIAQSYGNFAGARSGGLAHATVALADLWSAHHNQAGLAYIEQMQVGASFQQRYQLSELNLGQAAVAIPTKFGTLGVAVQYFGFELYNESKLGLSYSRKFGPYLAAALQVNYLQNTVAEGTNSHLVNFEGGIMARPSEGLQVGFHLYNPLQLTSESDDFQEPSRLGRLGVRYQFSDDYLALLEIRKSPTARAAYALGMEYALLDFLLLRVGASLRDIDAQPSAGLGVRWKEFELSTAWQGHPILGNQLVYSLDYQL